MRLLALSLLAFAAGLYSVGAVFFGEQERWARAAPVQTGGAVGRLVFHHPEATLGAIRGAFEANNFSPDVLTHVNRSLSQAPSFYQPPFLLATFHASRIEAPEQTRRGFEAAVRRYPANGRLHLKYADWILSSRLNFLDQSLEPGRASQVAEAHVKEALRLEPVLTGAALGLLQSHSLPADVWISVVPQDLAAQRQLFHALARAGHRSQALNLLERILHESATPEILQEAADLALRWGDPALALEAARLWYEEASAPDASPADLSRASLQLARTYLERGEGQPAYRVLRNGLKEIEARSSASSTASLDLLCGMAYEYLHRGQAAMAESLFAEATAVSPYYAPAFLGLARTYRQEGNKPAAIEQYQKVLELEPENGEADRELAPLILEREMPGTGR